MSYSTVDVPPSRGQKPPVDPSDSSFYGSASMAAAAISDWKTLSELPADLRPDQDEVVSALSGPKLARAWAHAIVKYWSRLERLGALDLSQPLYILDFAPGNDGALAASILGCLKSEMHSLGMVGWPVRYVLCSRLSNAPAGALLDSPALEGFVACGWLDHAGWLARPGHPLLLGPDRFALFGSRNPVVAIAVGGFSALPVDLYGVHYGDLALARWRTEILKSGRFRLSCDWLPLPVGDMASSISAQLEHYRTSLIAATVSLSEPALSLLDSLADFSTGRYLLLAADRGIADEREIRIDRMVLPGEVAAGQLEVPVNFHALGWHQENAGACVAHLAQNGLVQHFACRDDALGVDAASWESLIVSLDEATPSDRWWHASAAGPVEDIDEFNFRLRCSGYDPWVLQGMLETLKSDLLDSNAEGTLTALQNGVSRTWQMMTLRQRGETGLALCGLLRDLGCLKLAQKVMSELPDPDPGSIAYVNQMLLSARLEIETGRSASAMCMLRECLRLDSTNASALLLKQQLEQRFELRRLSPWYASENLIDLDLSLEPLDAMHIPAWLRQYRDPNIACMAGLPEIEDDTQARAHLERVEAVEGAEYAVMHRQLGLIGSIGMRCHADMAHIHFWIGHDYQGEGFGSRCTGLLIRSLGGSRIRHVFSTVFDGNVRSRQILQKKGFLPLPHVYVGDGRTYLFMHLSLKPLQAVSPDELLERLMKVREAIGEPMEVLSS
jgi:RimJ/RimL family protein N-acetyltransferase